MSKFQQLLESRYAELKSLSVLFEQEGEEMGMGDDTAQTDSIGMDSGNIEVSTGYAYLVNIIYNLLKYKPENLKPKYYNLSDNEVKNSGEAYRYFEVLKKFLPQNISSEVETKNFGEPDENPIEVDDATMVEMANTALKSLFFSLKDNSEFITNTEEIQSILSQSGNKVSVDNAEVIYQKIKEMVYF